jgi:hypothetical protein
MNTKKKDSWDRLSPQQIYLRFKAILEWREGAYQIYKKLQHKSEVNLLLKKLLCKNSADKALEVMQEISDYFDLPGLPDFCTQQKLCGLLGVNQVISIALSSIYSHSGFKVRFSGLFGKIELDYQQPVDVITTMKMHEEIEAKIRVLDVWNKTKLFNLIAQIRDMHNNKNYSLQKISPVLKIIRDLLSIKSDPAYYLVEKFNLIEFKMDENFFGKVRDKEAGGFFQHLCILFFSLDFPMSQE